MGVAGFVTGVSGALKSINGDGRRGLALLGWCALLLVPGLGGEPGRVLARYGPVALAAALAIDAGLWLWDSTVLWYVGSSGVLHGVLAAGALAQLRRGELTGWILAGLLIAKLAYEHWVGALPLSGSAAVVVDAHSYGVLGGATAAAFLKPERVRL